jgi:predicted TIM-barrel fold metal-dependent hydrolase
MRKYPNLYGELNDSAWTFLQRDHSYAIKFINEFQDRLFFATDYCSIRQERFNMLELLKEWRNSGKLTEAVFNKIARGNAIRIFDL